MAKDMYITLPSNTKDFTDSNKTHTFRVQLPHSISLEGNWEVSLSEIQYPLTWRNVYGNQIVRVAYTKPVSTALRKIVSNIPVVLRGRFPDGTYNTTDALVGGVKFAIRDAIQTKDWVEACIKLNSYNLSLLRKYKSTGFIRMRIRKQLRLSAFWINPNAITPYMTEIRISDGEAAKQQRLLNEYKQKKAAYTPALFTTPESEIEKELSFSFVKGTNQLKLDLSGKTIKALMLPEKLQYMLGLKRKILKEGSTIATYSRDFSGGLTTLYVHCSIIEPQIIGNYRSELLRAIPVSSKHKFGDTVHKSFTNPHYVNVQHKHFDNICIEIRTDEGHSVPFEYGKVIVKLHFRKSKGL